MLRFLSLSTLACCLCLGLFSAQRVESKPPPPPVILDSCVIDETASYVETIYHPVTGEPVGFRANVKVIWSSGNTPGKYLQCFLYDPIDAEWITCTVWPTQSTSVGLGTNIASNYWFSHDFEAFSNLFETMANGILARCEMRHGGDHHLMEYDEGLVFWRE